MHRGSRYAALLCCLYTTSFLCKESPIFYGFDLIPSLYAGDTAATPSAVAPTPPSPITPGQEAAYQNALNILQANREQSIEQTLATKRAADHLDESSSRLIAATTRLTTLNARITTMETNNELHRQAYDVYKIKRQAADFAQNDFDAAKRQLDNATEKMHQADTDEKIAEDALNTAKAQGAATPNSTLITLTANHDKAAAEQTTAKQNLTYADSMTQQKATLLNDANSQLVNALDTLTQIKTESSATINALKIEAFGLEQTVQDYEAKKEKDAAHYIQESQKSAEIQAIIAPQMGIVEQYQKTEQALRMNAAPAPGIGITQTSEPSISTTIQSGSASVTASQSTTNAVIQPWAITETNSLNNNSIQNSGSANINSNAQTSTNPSSIVVTEKNALDPSVSDTDKAGPPQTLSIPAQPYEIVSNINMTESVQSALPINPAAAPDPAHAATQGIKGKTLQQHTKQTPETKTHNMPIDASPAVASPTVPEQQQTTTDTPVVLIDTENPPLHSDTVQLIEDGDPAHMASQGLAHRLPSVSNPTPQDSASNTAEPTVPPLPIPQQGTEAQANSTINATLQYSPAYKTFTWLEGHNAPAPSVTNDLNEHSKIAARAAYISYQ